MLRFLTCFAKDGSSRIRWRLAVVGLCLAGGLCVGAGHAYAATGGKADKGVATGRPVTDAAVTGSGSGVCTGPAAAGKTGVSSPVLSASASTKVATADPVRPGGTGPSNPGHHHGRRGDIHITRAVLQEAAKQLKLPVSDLFGQLQSGRSLAEVAREKGIAPSTLERHLQQVIGAKVNHKIHTLMNRTDWRSRRPQRLGPEGH
jgi:hypothetical protein